MLPKKIRLTTGLFDQVFRTGKVEHGRLFWMRSASLPTGLPSRFAVAVSKKVAKTAVLRNKMKRVVYRAIETLDKDVLAGESSVMTIFGVKKDISGALFEEVVQELRDLLLKKGQK
jgi:ribonuclease P protein component